MAEPQEPPKKSAASLVRMLIAVAAVIVIPAALGLSTFFFVLRPLLAQDAQEPVQEQLDIIPPGVVMVDFDESQATVLTEDPNMAAPLLMYRVSMAVSSLAAKSLVEEQKSWFNAMLSKLHRNRTRAELNDPFVQDNILRQAKQEANLLLKKLAPKGSFEVIDVMYTKYAIIDL